MLEELFALVEHCKVGDIEVASRMPVTMRRWWIERWQEEQKEIARLRDELSKGK